MTHLHCYIVRVRLGITRSRSITKRKEDNTSIGIHSNTDVTVGFRVSPMLLTSEGIKEHYPYNVFFLYLEMTKFGVSKHPINNDVVLDIKGLTMFTVGILNQRMREGCFL